MLLVLVALEYILTIKHLGENHGRPQMVSDYPIISLRSLGSNNILEALKKTRKNQDIDFSRKSRFSGNYVVIFKTTVLVGYLIFLRNF